MISRPWVNVLGIDPGFAHCGIGVVRLFPEGEQVVRVGVIRTQKADRKHKVLSTDDNFRRARHISTYLNRVIVDNHVQALAAEAKSYPRNASASAKVAMTWGVLADIVEMRKMPMVQITPQSMKKRLCGKISATKTALQDVLLRRYPGQFEVFMSRIPKGQWEHGFDAVGAVVSCLDDDVLLVARRMVGDERYQQGNSVG